MRCAWLVVTWICTSVRGRVPDLDTLSVTRVPKLVDRSRRQSQLFVEHHEVTVNIVNPLTSEVVYSVQGAGEYSLSEREVLGFGSTASYDATLNGKVLDPHRENNHHSRRPPDVLATLSVLAQMSLLLAASGFYVMPVSLVDETLRLNGMQVADDSHQIALPKLREIFGADAVLYVTVKSYGAVYRVVSSEAVVAMDAKLVDLRNSQLLWEGSARASSA